MEWKVLLIFVFIFTPLYSMHAVRKTSELSSTVIQNGRKIHRASLALCRTDQTYFCANYTHYIPCTRINKSNFSSFRRTQPKEYDCGLGRCCRPGDSSPCSYECAFRSSDFVNPHLRWNVLNQNVYKNLMGLKEPLNVEDVDRQNKIVSVKNFIVRQKHVDATTKWKPSYRRFCNVQLCSLQGNCTTSTTTITTIKTTVTPLTTTRTTTTTTRKPTTTTTTLRTTTKTNNAWSCTKKLLGRKEPVKGSCVDYLMCELVNNIYEWRLYSCSGPNYFDKRYQSCRNKNLVKCVEKPKWQKFLQYTSI